MSLRLVAFAVFSFFLLLIFGLSLRERVIRVRSKETSWDIFNIAGGLNPTSSKNKAKRKSLGLTIEQRNLLSPKYTETPRISRDDSNVPKEQVILKAPATNTTKLKRGHSRSRSTNSPLKQSDEIYMPSVHFIDLANSKEETEPKRRIRKSSNTPPAIHIYTQLTKNFFSDSIDGLQKKSKNILSSSEPEIQETDDTPAIYEILFGQEWMTSGTLNQMIKFMTGPVQNATWVHTFLLTYVYHCTDDELMRKLIKMFKSYPIRSDEVNLVQLRVIRILGRWKSMPCYCYSDCSTSAKNRFSEFIKFLATHESSIALHWAQELSCSNNFISLTGSKVYKPITRISRKDSLKEKRTIQILDLDPSQLAQQLTLLDHRLLSNIKLNELVHGKWMKSKKDSLAPNVIAFASQFNTISRWVATEILVASNETKTEVLAHWIKVEENLYALDNFNGLMAVHAGLNFHEISRLKPIWKELSDRRLRKFAAVEDLMSTENNFSNYRTRLTQTKPPFIPFQSRVLGDLTAVDQMVLYLEDGSVNFHKLIEIGQMLKLIELAQSARYEIEENFEIQNYLQEVFALSKSVMFAISEQCLANMKRQQFPMLQKDLSGD